MIQDVCPDKNESKHSPIVSDCCNPWAASVITKSLGESGVASILVAWAHAHIFFLAKHLGAPQDDIPPWDREDYDSILTISFTCSPQAGCSYTSMSVGKQNFHWYGPDAPWEGK